MDVVAHCGDSLRGEYNKGGITGEKNL